MDEWGLGIEWCVSVCMKLKQAINLTRYYTERKEKCEERRQVRKSFWGLGCVESSL
jgi:hypothetical protein